MISSKILRVIFFAIVCGGIPAITPAAFCQQPAQTRQVQRDDDTNLDTQLYLILATNRDVEDGKMPAALEPVIKRLRESLPFKHYALAGTFLNRVKNYGHLDVSWVGGPFMNSSAVVVGNPSFNEFKVNTVKVITDAAGQSVVRMEGFGFGARIPIQTGAVASTSPMATVVNYESTGLNTDISMREGEPVVVGTLHVGPSGDAIILVMSAKRSNK